MKASSADNDSLVYELSHLGLIAVSGVDAQSFLQSQFANDVRQVGAETSQINVYCSAKGRALAVFRLFKHADSYSLLLPQDILADTLKRLRLFVLRAQVTLENASQRLARIGVAGSQAQAHLQAVLGFAPIAMNTVESNRENTLTVLRIPGLSARFVITGEHDAVNPLATTLTQGNTLSAATAWSLLDIQAGIPSIAPATVDAFVPQMLNLDALQGISFSKGCYPGQEIVARMHYLGTLKRRMYRAQVESLLRPDPGAELYGAVSEQAIGMVVDAQPVSESSYELLAVLQIAHADSGKVRLHHRQGPLLQLQPLPYAATEG